MKTSKRWETLVSILIWMIIDSIILTSLVIIHSSNYYNQAKFINENKKIIVRNNLARVIRDMDIKEIWVWEKFYIIKNNENKTYLAVTWSENESYKYINEKLQNINPSSNEINIYTAEFTIKNEDDILNKKNKIVKININELTNK